VALPHDEARHAKQAEAERERRAKIVKGEGEFQAAEKMVQAAAMMSKEPIALQLRFCKRCAKFPANIIRRRFSPFRSTSLTALIKKSEPPKS